MAFRAVENAFSFSEQFDGFRFSGIRAECELVCEDMASGKNARRPGLKRALRRLRPGDVLVVWKLDRLGRSVRDLITLVSELQARGVNFRSLTDSIDTSTPAGRFFFHVMSALAEMERELIVERTRAGLAAAREQGRVGGRRRVMTTEVVERCRRMLENGATRQEIADVTGVGVKTIYKYLPVALTREPLCRKLQGLSEIV
ncbi:TPA: recombinase family protein [Klebsiella variicola subsp. variicola]|nr:recombinase family protein [Klebsiella variicola]AXA30696.1 DNA-invertase [Klebsiella variicola]